MKRTKNGTNEMTRTRNGNDTMVMRRRLPQKNLMARHEGKYKGEKFVRDVYLLAVLGARDIDIATFFDVNVTTIDNWKRVHPEFLKAMKQGKAEADMKVAESLFKRAIGYEYKEKEVTIGTDRRGNPVEVVKTHKKKMAPDVTAMIFWLKNRQRTLWADVQKVDMNTNINLNKKIDISLYSKDEQVVLKQMLIKQLTGNVSR